MTPTEQLKGSIDRIIPILEDPTLKGDGKITLNVLNEMQAAGLTPDQLRAAIVKGASTVRTPL